MTSLERFRAKVKDGKVFRHGKWIEVEMPEAAPAKVKQPSRPFTKVLLREAAAAAKATRAQQAFIWIWLQYRAWQTRNSTFSVPSASLKAYGISRMTKMRALVAYEKAGLISVVHCKTKAPVVTMLVPTA